MNNPALAAVPGPGNDQKLIDDVVYLASLVSNPADIGPVMDAVRAITARLTPGAEVRLSESDKAELQKVYAYLFDYLMHHDRIRAFSREALEHQLREHTEQPNRRQSARDLAIILGVTAGAYLFSSLVFVLFGAEHAWMLGSPIAVAVMYIGIVRLFWSALSTFTANLRGAYVYICIGTLILGASAVGEAFLNVFPHLTHIHALSYGGPLPVFVLAFVFTYLGMRKFAHALEASPWFTRLSIVVPILAAAALAGPFLPHQPVPSELFFALAMVCMVLFIGLGLLIGGLGIYIGRRLTKPYAKAIIWMGLGYGWTGLAGIGIVIAELLGGPLYDVRFNIAGLSLSLAAYAVLAAGYTFRRSVGKT